MGGAAGRARTGPCKRTPACAARAAHEHEHECARDKTSRGISTSKKERCRFPSKKILSTSQKFDAVPIVDRADFGSSEHNPAGGDSLYREESKAYANWVGRMPDSRQTARQARGRPEEGVDGAPSHLSGLRPDVGQRRGVPHAQSLR